MLQPSEWVGGELPLLPYLREAPALTNGSWIVLLWDSQCPNCISAREFLDTLRIDKQFVSKTRFAIVDVGTAMPPAEVQGCLCTSLVDVSRWVTMSPAIILLKNGSVEQVWEQDIPSREIILARLNNN